MTFTERIRTGQIRTGTTADDSRERARDRSPVRRHQFRDFRYGIRLESGRRISGIRGRQFSHFRGGFRQSNYRHPRGQGRRVFTPRNNWQYRRINRAGGNFALQYVPVFEQQPNRVVYQQQAAQAQQPLIPHQLAQRQPVQFVPQANQAYPHVAAAQQQQVPVQQPIQFVLPPPPPPPY